MDRQFDDFSVGDTVSFARRFTPDDFAAFSALSGDRSPLHHDVAYAAQSSLCRPIVPLQLAAAPLSAVAGMFLPGHRSLLLDSQVRAIEPVDYGVDVVYSAQIVAKHPALRALSIRVIALHGHRVHIEGLLRVRVRDDAPPGAWSDESELTMENSLRNRVALVTGATGTIGRAICRTLARIGWTMILHHRGSPHHRGDEERAAKCEWACRREGAETHRWHCELGSAASRRESLAALARLPAASLLVHTASPRIDAPLAELMEVNYAALRELSETLLVGMLRRQRGQIMFLGSSAVERSPYGWDDYIAAKAAATHYLGALDRRFATYGVRGTVVAPAFVLSDFSNDHRPAGSDDLLPEEVAETVAELAEQVKHRAGGYVSLDVGMVRRGAFGFHPSPRPAALAERALPSANDSDDANPDCGAGVPPVGGGPGFLAATAPARKPAPPLESLVRRTLRLSNTAELSEAGLDATPGWDSLGHLQLLLAVESALGISFSSQELSQTTRYADLRRLVEIKQGRSQ